MTRIIYTILLLLSTALIAFAGNPDRQGEAGAGQLLLNPWAGSAGLHSMNTSSIMGVEALRLNPAGIGRISQREIRFSNTRLYEGSELQLNAVGYAQRAGTNGAFGFSLMIVDFGDIPITTANQPEGTGATYSPSFVNLGMGYSYTYENKISVGILARVVSETLTNINSFGVALDAGVQYVSGPKDNFKLGISLRNIGAPMKYGGQGLSQQILSPDTESPYILSFDVRPEDYELPSVLNIGISYDFFIKDDLYLRGLANFTSNAFSRDQVGGGVELQFRDILTLRGGYKYEVGSNGSTLNNIYTGPSGGLSINLPFGKASKSRIGIDYAYRSTNPFRGSHNFGIKLTF